MRIGQLARGDRLAFRMDPCQIEGEDDEEEEDDDEGEDDDEDGEDEDDED